MRISRLFTQQELKPGTSTTLDSKQSHYLTHVLRVKPSQSIILFNGLSQHDYISRVITTGKSVEVDIIEHIKTHLESPLDITITQALSKNEHMDIMLQKCTELGVKSFIIFNSERTQQPIKSNKLDKKLAHWQRTIQSACEQCGRSMTPSITFFSNIYTAVPHSTSELRIMLDFDGTALQQHLAANDKSPINILLGAEGGLSNAEIGLAESVNFVKARLGLRVLRTETAAITATSLIQMLKGDLG